MTLDEFKTFCQEKYDATALYLWDDLDACVWRHHANGKWFAIYQRVRADHLSLEHASEFYDLINVKIEPELRDGLLAQPGFLPAYRMNKNHWISFLLNDKRINNEQIAALVSLSWHLTSHHPT
ncbi:MmcQ/YjbR family DNA-binding protein [bacterium]|nr:MmcQ/YjbR family DNA-binding protein [bacterium]